MKAVENELIKGNESSEQLTFALRPSPSVSESHFIASPSNALARRWLSHTGWPDRRLLLTGKAASGKSHLLHIWADRLKAPVVEASTLDGSALAGHYAILPPAMAIDHLENIVAEDVLLHLLNMAREQRTTVLIAARAAPSSLPLVLADLASRLRAITVVSIGDPEDSHLFALMLRLLAERRLVLPEHLIGWLLCHLPRTTSAVAVAVDLLDQAGLSQGRPITRAMAKKILSELLA